ncbi:MAG: asparagine synthase (glutamine-hydrolyzing) [Bacteroidia bacterium]
MCGIAGVFAFSETGKEYLHRIDRALKCLVNRGPDKSGVYKTQNIALAHTRLAIIDPTDAASQPMSDGSGRYYINFNGEIFNFKELREQLISSGIDMKSHSDTEVVLQMYIKEGTDCLNKLNGFFAFAIYDNVEQKLFLARDRMGIKPLLIYCDEDKLIFGSEMKAMMELGIPKDLDEVSLFSYLQLNYIPPPWSIFKNVRKLEPGSWMVVDNEGTKNQKVYYEIPEEQTEIPTYDQAKDKLYELLDQSVQRRMTADVPLGAFLSGGKDSSIIVALASRYQKSLKTFSIGFKDEPMFDETYYAKLVAKKYNTDHFTFSLTNNDLYEHLHKILDYIDEPFADSSAIAVNILSHETRKHVKVALSGDGADEMFAGYNKHRAEFLAQKNGLSASLLKLSKPLWAALPKSRSNPVKNKIRQLHRFTKAASMSAKDRYWHWATFTGEDEIFNLMNMHRSRIEYNRRKEFILRDLDESGNLNDILKTDMRLVLQGDMLHKVDSMSMANSLEVRVPYLDYKLVDFVFSLPGSYKIDSRVQKKLLVDTFGDLLPGELLNRRKQGFEVPLLKWFRSELKSMITDELLEDEFIIAQGLFEVTETRKLKRKLFSSNPDDIHAQIWSLIVFQYWWKKNMN